jgi:hypothetical protein
MAKPPSQIRQRGPRDHAEQDESSSTNNNGVETQSRLCQEVVEPANDVTGIRLVSVYLIPTPPQTR